MSYLVYVVLNEGLRERVAREDCDASEQAGIIDRCLIPVYSSGHGWAESRKSGYTVTGEIKSNTAKLILQDEGVPIALLGICLKAKASAGLWDWLKANAATPLPDNGPVPQGAWAALRYDAPVAALPPWIHWWAKHVGFALMTREGW